MHIIRKLKDDINIIIIHVKHVRVKGFIPQLQARLLNRSIQVLRLFTAVHLLAPFVVATSYNNRYPGDDKRYQGDYFSHHDANHLENCIYCFGSARFCVIRVQCCTSFIVVTNALVSAASCNFLSVSFL